MHSYTQYCEPPCIRVRHDLAMPMPPSFVVCSHRRWQARHHGQQGAAGEQGYRDVSREDRGSSDVVGFAHRRLVNPACTMESHSAPRITHVPRLRVCSFAAASARGVQVAFESAVAGGIPIIKAVREGLAGAYRRRCCNGGTDSDSAAAGRSAEACALSILLSYTSVGLTFPCDAPPTDYSARNICSQPHRVDRGHHQRDLQLHLVDHEGYRRVLPTGPGTGTGTKAADIVRPQW